jgi:hypothetical protein
MFKYSPRSATQILLRLLDYEIKIDVHSEVLSVLGQGIKASSTRINRADALGADDYAEAVVDAEIEIIEGLLGAAYVVCQTRVTAIAQAALHCRARIIADGLAFTSFGDKDYEVRRRGPRFNGQFSQIELLWALANYFKHRDEWPSDVWSNPQGLARHTVAVLLPAGLQPCSNGNLRTGAEALGMPEYADTTVLENTIRKWADEVREEIWRSAGS